MRKTLTLRLDDTLHRRLKTKLAVEGTTFQAKMEAMIHEYLDGQGDELEEIAGQVELARKVMRRYAPALRELAR